MRSLLSVSKYMLPMLVLAVLACPQWVSAQAQPIDISADKLTVNQSAQTATFSGSVQATQADIELRCATLTANYRSKGIETLTASGNVQFKRTLQGQAETATSDRAVYNPASQLLTLTGNVQLKRDGNVLRGQTLVYHLATNQITLSSNNRVSGQFQSGGGNLSPVPTIKTGQGTTLSRTLSFPSR